MYAIGSSYLIRQKAGAEKFGGVTIQICSCAEANGKLDIIATDWLTEELIEDDIQFLIDGVTEGIKQFALNNSLALEDWEITISKLAYHPVDSSRHTFQITAYNAIASAFASWNSIHLVLNYVEEK